MLGIRGRPGASVGIPPSGMRLLFDQNLSPRLKEMLRDLYPGSTHTRDIGLGSADDITVWAYARDHDFVIASKDSDFRQLSSVFGYPPQVIWIRCGNCSTTEIASILRNHYNDLLAFCQDERRAFFELNREHYSSLIDPSLGP